MQQPRPDGDNFSLQEIQNRQRFSHRFSASFEPRSNDDASPNGTPRLQARPMLISEDEDERGIMVDFDTNSDATSVPSDFDVSLNGNLFLDDVEIDGIRRRQSTEAAALETVNGDDILRHVDDCIGHLRRNLQITVAQGFENILKKVARIGTEDVPPMDSK